MTDQVAFVGLGANAVCWYRCVLPAMALASDWMGIVGRPPEMRFVTGLVKGSTQRPEWGDYKLVVVQQPRGREWARWIQAARERGIKVVYEIDDYVHGIARMPEHDFRQHFGRDDLAEMELCMKLCDAMICSTDYLGRRYRKYNRHVHVCENGLDLDRYRLTRPPRKTVNLGWAGATGHQRSVVGWLEAVGRIMERHDNTCFISIGQAFADYFKSTFPTRVVSIPFTLVDIYPAAMTMFDIALAPAGPGNFFRGKSDLRWLEAGALGIPTIANPIVYPRIEHGITGFKAENPQQVEELLELLLGDEELRIEVGENARRYVAEERSMAVAAQAWIQAFREILTA
jgi:glycosyltransferase involved in cell wall biosynthesis